MQIYLYTNSFVYKHLCLTDTVRELLWSFDSVGVYGLQQPKQMYIELSSVVLLEEMTQYFTDVISDFKSWDPFADIPG